MEQMEAHSTGLRVTSQNFYLVICKSVNSNDHRWQRQK